MSMQNSFIINNSSSSNMLQTINNKNMNEMTNYTSIYKKQNSFKNQAISYLKTSINSMIKDQIKAYRLQKKLQKELQQYKKVKQKKLLIQDLHKIQKFRVKQSQLLKSKFDQYIKQKQKKDSHIQQFLSTKNQLIKRKQQQHNKKVQYVRKRYYEQQNQDVSNRLSRADSTLSHKSTIARQNSKTSRPNRNLHTSLNQRHFMHHSISDQEQKRITNYLKKMKHAQSRIIEKQIKNQERKQKSIKSQVKNLTKQRNLKEQNKIKELQQKLDTKMESFYQNFTKSQFQHTNLLMNKSRLKEQIRQKVIRNKSINDSQLINKTLQNFMRKRSDKQNLYRNHQRKIDLLRTKSSFMNNTIQIQKQQLQKQNQKNIRILYQKLSKIKNLKPNQTIPQKQRQALLNLIDNEDPFYNEISQFLSNTKSQFLKKKLQKQQQKAKADKTKKTARFNNKN